jgi:hypothetical protein
MRIPTVHRNGTSKQELEDQVREAYLQVSIAIAALEAASPNGRDYYLQGETAINEATKEHLDRMKRLVSVRAELMHIWEGIVDQETNR